MKLSTSSIFLTLWGGHFAAAQLQAVPSFGTNKSGTKMFIYEPKSGLPTNPAIVVGIHYCTGTAQKYFNSNPGLHELADQKKFVVIYPESPNSGGCWDVSSRATLKRNGGADSQGIAEMVKWAVDKYKADGKRVFAIGESSGGMMAVCCLFSFLFLLPVCVGGSVGGRVVIFLCWSSSINSTLSMLVINLLSLVKPFTRG